MFQLLESTSLSSRCFQIDSTRAPYSEGGCFVTHSAHPAPPRKEVGGGKGGFGGGGESAGVIAKLSELGVKDVVKPGGPGGGGAAGDGAGQGDSATQLERSGPPDWVRWVCLAAAVG